MLQGQALALAQEYLDRAGFDENVQIIAETTQETEEGWLFFFQSESFLKTGNPDTALKGAVPLFVDRAGKVYLTRPGEEAGVYEPVHHHS